jgi:deoxyribonuclease IV
MPMLFGAHVSVSKGYFEALDYAESVGCECMQVFAKSPRQWHARPIDRDAASAFVEQRQSRDFGPLFTHTAYLINIGTDDPVLRARSVEALADELVRGAALDAAGVVTHVGTDPLGDASAAAARIGEAIADAYQFAGDEAAGTRLLLENAAGAGRTFGVTIEELAACVEAADQAEGSVGICVDTCHAFASGMPLGCDEGWQELVTSIEDHCGISALGLIHANDSKFELGSRRDRHAWIGDGAIGEVGFRAMLAQADLRGVAVCVESSGSIPEKDVVNISRLREMRDQTGSSTGELWEQ